MPSTAPVEFVLSQPVNAELISTIRGIDGVNHAWNEYRCAVEVRVARLSDPRTVIEAVAHSVVAHFEWEPDEVLISLDGEPLNPSR